MSTCPTSGAGDAQDPPRVAELWYLARRAVHRLERAADRDLRAAAGLPLATYVLLRALDDPACGNQQGIADVLGLTKGSVSRQVEQAAAAGLVTAEVSASSRRDKVVRLTDAGRRAVAAADEVLHRYRQPAGAADLDVTLRTLASVQE